MKKDSILKESLTQTNFKAKDDKESVKKEKYRRIMITEVTEEDPLAI